MVQSIENLDLGKSARCFNCHQKIFSRKNYKVQIPMALAFAGFILFFPAVLSPVITLKVLGEVSTTNLFTGIKYLFLFDFPDIAAIVLFFSVIIPFLKLIFINYILLITALKLKAPFSVNTFKAYNILDTWGMQEVFLLGVLVALTKLDSIAEVYIGPGFYCFLGLILINTLISTTMDKQRIWEKLEKI